MLVLRSDGTPTDWGGDSNLTNITERQECRGSGLQRLRLRSPAFGRHGGGIGRDAWHSGLPPVPASAINIVAIATGWYGVAALRADGTLLTWGQINIPQFGFANLLDLACPMSSLFAACDVLGLTRDGTLIEYSSSAPASAAGHISAIAAGSSDGLAAVGNGPPVFPGLPVNRTVPVGSMAYFRAVAAGAMPISYQWSCNGTNIPGATNSVWQSGLSNRTRPEMLTW